MGRILGSRHCYRGFGAKGLLPARDENDDDACVQMMNVGDDDGRFPRVAV